MRVHRSCIFLLGLMTFCGAFVVTAGIAAAECIVKSKGQAEVIGRFQLRFAHSDCLMAYRKSQHARSKSNSDLFLECGGPRKRIAVMRSGHIYEKQVVVAGCPR